MLLTIKQFGEWYYVIVAGRQDAYGYSTEAAAQRRMVTILNGWI